jgi:anaerobic magnesium-protoporphyrin IX monomethyl ester cyclase
LDPINTNLPENKTSKEILLVYPGKYRAADPQIPLPLLYIAGPLIRAGYKTSISDMRIDNFKHLKIGEPLFVGISSMSGPQIEFGLKFAKKVRNVNPSIPIVWGGVHPTLLPEQTVASPFVDIVVRGEGELTAVQLANQLMSEQPIQNVKGITYKKQGKIITNPQAAPINLDSLPIELPYDLLKLDEYPALKAGRLHIQTSRGCPGRCGFCYNLFFSQRQWRGKSAKRVFEEIKFLLEKFPNVKTLDIIDDNFFVNRKRVEDICEGLLILNDKIQWRANCRFDYVATYQEDFLRLLDKTGCVELDFGGESGSEKLQSFVTKDVTFSQMFTALKKLKMSAPHIEPFVSWLSGLPNETSQDLHKTFNLMDKMRQINSKTQHYGIFIYTPFPSPLLESLPPEFKQPQTLEEWGRIEVFHFNPPWHTKKYVKQLHTISAITRYSFYPKTRINERGLLYRTMYQIMNKIARYRWKHRYFGFPIEEKIVDYAAKKLRGFM